MYYILAMSWSSQYPDYFRNTHDALFYSEVNASNTSVSVGTKHYCLWVCTWKAHLVEDYRNIFLLQVMKLYGGHVTHSE